MFLAYILSKLLESCKTQNSFLAQTTDNVPISSGLYSTGIRKQQSVSNGGLVAMGKLDHCTSNSAATHAGVHEEPIQILLGGQVPFTSLLVTGCLSSTIILSIACTGGAVQEAQSFYA